MREIYCDFCHAELSFNFPIQQMMDNGDVDISFDCCNRCSWYLTRKLKRISKGKESIK